MHTEGHDPGRPSGTSPHPTMQRDAEHPGYETTDVNVAGVAVFLAGLLGFLVVFFVFCYGMGKVINTAFEKQDGPVTKWNQRSTFDGTVPNGGKREDLASNPELEQRALKQMTETFPTPRLETDDGEQDIADLHAREDLLLDHYSTIDGQPGAVRIPIDRAMDLIAQRGLPLAPATTVVTTQMTGDATPVVQAPLTTGFARTGYELETIEAREQKLQFTKAEGAEK